MDDAWALSPQEWWELWSFKYGSRRRIIDGTGLTDSDASNMRRALDAEVAKEKDRSWLMKAATSAT